MTRAAVLTAGKATRAGRYAPDGCKALVDLGGRPVIGWQMDAFYDAGLLAEDLLIVCRSEHAGMLESYGEIITNDRGRGSADALGTALPWVKDGQSIVVAYADSFFTEVPKGTDWVGTSTAQGGRSWDVIRDGYVNYEHVAEDWQAKVAVGLYAFSDVPRLAHIIDRLTTKHIWSQPEMGLGPVLNDYATWREVHIPSWHDCGDEAAIEAWSA